MLFPKYYYKFRYELLNLIVALTNVRKSNQFYPSSLYLSIYCLIYHKISSDVYRTNSLNPTIIITIFPGYKGQFSVITFPTFFVSLQPSEP